MSITAKIWCPDDEMEPEGRLVAHIGPGHKPRNPLSTWFREPPEQAAELYALERWILESPKPRNERRTVYQVRIRDEDGEIHNFEVKLSWEMKIDAHVKRLGA
jgi:hypothetical protein